MISEKGRLFSDNLEVAKLVALHGFCCRKDISMFGNSLNRQFNTWVETYATCKGIVFQNIASTKAVWCHHIAYRSTLVVHPEILKLNKTCWFHVFHIQVRYNDEIFLSTILQSMVTCMLHDSLEIYCYKLCLVDKGEIVKDDIQSGEKTFHLVKVECKRNQGMLDFRICMKY